MYDSEGFAISFDCSQENEYLNFWKENGFVVIHKALNQTEVQSTIDEIWTDKTLLGKSGKIDRNDPETWSNALWPTEFGIAERGFLTFDSDYQSHQSWLNRQNKNVYKVFKSIFGRPDLWVNIDRYGAMRPTTGIKMKTEEGNETIVDRPEWLTRPGWLHWDQNPWSEPDFVRVQGLITLVDSTETSGGFHCIPGFHHLFKDWGISHESEKKRGGIINVPQDDPIRTNISKITMRSGSLLVWDSRLPHGNYPNCSNQFRMVQYITFAPAMSEEERKSKLIVFKDLNQRENKKKKEEKYNFPQGLTLLGRLLIGCEPWHSENIASVGADLLI